MTTCDECGTEIAEGAEVVVPLALVGSDDPDADTLGVGATLCAACVDRLDPEDTPDDGTRQHDGWAEPPLPVDDDPEPIADDAPPGDTYNREQAARVLGVSPRRVSQLAADGRLEVVQDKPLRLSAESVHRMREERRSPKRDQRATVPPDPAGDVAAQIERVVGLVVAEHRKAIEAGEHLLAEVTTQRDDLRAEVERLRSEVEAERVRREAAELAAAQPRRRWWQRG